MLLTSERNMFSPESPRCGSQDVEVLDVQTNLHLGLTLFDMCSNR